MKIGAESPTLTSTPTMKNLSKFWEDKRAHFSPEVSAAFMNLRDSRAEPGVAPVPSLTVLRILGGGVNKVH